MITLVASTITKLLKSENRPRLMLLMSDSTTITRLGYSQESIEMSTQGFAFTAYESVIIELPAGKELFAVSAGTPNLSLAEIVTAERAVRL